MTRLAQMSLLLAILAGIGLESAAQTPDGLSYDVGDHFLIRDSASSPLGWVLTDVFDSSSVGLIRRDPDFELTFENDEWWINTPEKKSLSLFFCPKQDFTGTLGCNESARFLSVDAIGAFAEDVQPYLIFDRSQQSQLLTLLSPLRVEGRQQVATTKTDLTAANLSSKVALRDLDDPLDPGRRRTWETDESVNMPVAGPLFAYGQFGASTPWVDQQTPPKWQGKYGVGLKIKPAFVDEVQVRGGPSIKSDDTGRWVRGPSGERSEMFVEAVTKVGIPVVGPINLEYTTTAVPPATAGERNLFNQDFKIARPLAGGGQVHLGAKLRADDVPTTASWVDRMQVYMGFELKR
jgi:hypothetical protein